VSFISRITTWVTGQSLTSSALNGEFNNVVNVLNNASNSAGYLLGTVVQTQQFVDTAATDTTSVSFQPTTTLVSITPKSTTHKIRISVTGTLEAANPASATSYVSIFRGSTDLSNGSGFVQLVGTAIGANNLQVPVGIVYLDSPATTSATTYTVKIHGTAGFHTYWNNFTGSATILCEEIAF
jgi:hypothetical protein